MVKKTSGNKIRVTTVATTLECWDSRWVCLLPRVLSGQQLHNLCRHGNPGTFSLHGALATGRPEMARLLWCQCAAHTGSGVESLVA